MHGACQSREEVASGFLRMICDGFAVFKRRTKTRAATNLRGGDNENPVEEGLVAPEQNDFWGSESNPACDLRTASSSRAFAVNGAIARRRRKDCLGSHLADTANEPNRLPKVHAAR